MLIDYFRPLDISSKALDEFYPADSLGSLIETYRAGDHFPDPQGAVIAIVGIGEDRGSTQNAGCAEGPDAIRRQLYRLKIQRDNMRIIDLGNLIPGETLEDTYSAVATVVSELVPLKVITLILGGSQDLTYGQYTGYKKLEQIINISGLDAYFDLGKPDESISSENYLGKIIVEQPNYLFNYSNLGYQSYYVGRESVELMKRLYFDVHRLGQLRNEIEETEPIVRNSDLFTVDISAIRQSDAPGCAYASPNGFSGEEACQIMLYAGISDKLSGIGLYEYNPAFDINHQTAGLIAQMIWYFIEGVATRKNDQPMGNPNQYITYRVTVNSLDNEITFIKSIKSDRWWMKLPVEGSQNRYASHRLMPCTYRDYQQACGNEVPDRWWNAIHKLSS